MTEQPRPASDRPLRIGVLGAARITPMALIAPARRVAEVEVVAVAARDRARAEKFAARQRIAKVHASYADLIADPDVDAIYNPLPNSHHCEWTIRALEAGKHVLCEKPLASNAEEARQMAEAADRTGRILMEAFHWRYHPIAERARSLLREGRVGKIERIEVAFCIPLWSPGNIRYRLDLAGGAAMDLGAYTVNMLRYFGEAEPVVVSARARLARAGVDRFMRAEFAYADGRSGGMTCSLFSASVLRLSLRVTGASGRLSLFNPIAPQIYHSLTLENRDGRTRERLAAEPTYTGQLRAFVHSVQTGERPPSDAWDGVANMAVIDSIYRHAGLAPRGT